MAFSGCQPSFLAFLGLTFLCAAGEEAASPREEDSDADEEDAVEGEEAGAAVSVVQYSALEARGSFLEVQYSEREQLPSLASPHWSTQTQIFNPNVKYCFIKNI